MPALPLRRRPKPPRARRRGDLLIFFFFLLFSPTSGKGHKGHIPLGPSDDIVLFSTFITFFSFFFFLFLPTSGWPLLFPF